MKAAVPFAKNILAPLGITLTSSVIEAGIQRNTSFRENNFNNFKQRNNGIIKIVLALKNSNILLKGITETIENEEVL